MDYIDKIDMENENVAKLVDSIKNEGKKLVIFAGAGISALGGLPLWNSFAKNLVYQCYEDGLIQYNEKEDYLRISESKMLITLIYNIYQEKGKRNLFFEHFSKNLEIKSNNKKAKKIINALKSMKASIITTNADEMLDECVHDKRRDILYGENIYSIKKDDSWILNPKVIHIHGSVKDNESLIFTVKKYLEHYSRENNDFYEYMKDLMNNKNLCFLFIGSSMTEMELLQYVVKSGDVNNKFILNGFFENQKMIEKSEELYYLDCFGIRQISYSMDKLGYSNIIEFLKDLSKEITLSTQITSRMYDEAIDTIKSGNIKDIISNIRFNDGAISSELLAKLFEEINKSSIASLFYVKLYEECPDYFDLSVYDPSNKTIQYIVVSSISSYTNQVNDKEFNSLINKISKNLRDIILDNSFELDKKTNLVYIFADIVKKNIKYNSSKLIDVIKKLKECNASCFYTLIYEVSKFDLPRNSAYKITMLLLNQGNNKTSINDIYEIDTFISKNLTKVLGYKSNGIFFKLRKEILKIEKKEKFAYGDMGAIYDYLDNKNYNYLSFNEYLIKLIKTIIDNMKPSDTLKAFNTCTLSFTMDRKIKLYIIDSHFSEMEYNLLNKEIIDSIDSVASLYWIIKNHKDSINMNTEYKEKFIDIIEKCSFSEESENEIEGLRYIIKDTIYDKDYKLNENNKSYYKNCDPQNIGKHFWIMSNSRENEALYKKISNMTVEEVINEINDNSDKSYYYSNGIKKYFSIYENVLSILNDPNLFLLIKNEKYYCDVLTKLYDDNNLDKEMIKSFINRVYKEKYKNSNAWIWIKILEKNDLIKDYEFSVKILNYIFNKLLEDECELDIYGDNVLNITINNMVYRCVEQLCLAHIYKNDICDFVNDLICKYRNSNNYFYILSAIASYYSKILEKDERIETILDNVFQENKEKEIIALYNNMIFSDSKKIFKFLKYNSFINYFSKINKQSRKHYLLLILTNYMLFEDELIKFAVDNIDIDCSAELIENYIYRKYGELEKLLWIIDLLTKKSKISSYLIEKLLELFIKYPDNMTIKKIYSNIVILPKLYVNWDKIETKLYEAQSIDEQFTVESIFIPISKKYIEADHYYIEDKYYDVFKNIYNSTNKIYLKEKLEVLANEIFQLGFLKFKNIK